MEPNAETPDLIFDAALIKKYDQTGPRYTSYPTADRLVEAHGSDTHCDWLQRRGDSFSRGLTPLSLYVHIPFCDTVCFYCACNKVATKDHGRSAKYLRYLAREAALTAKAMSGSRRVEQLHLGGGTPTFLSSAEFRELMSVLARHFELGAGEYSIEIDPRTVDDEKMRVLYELGFNRVSLGVQDFDPLVQAAVNRHQPIEVTANAVHAARRVGMNSVNIDLIYGLPHQSEVSFDRTLAQVIELDPDRIALYSYAHLPHVFKPQRRIAESMLPSPAEKLRILSLATRVLVDAGYVYIGMDHFAKPHDSLAIAARQGRLHRNFQGYSTHADCDLVALGISAISKVGPTYSQNVRTLNDYYDRIDAGELPVMRGVELSQDDLLRRAVISSLMCHFELSIESIEIAHLVEFRKYFRNEWTQLEALAADGLIELDDQWITVTARGRLLVRAVAMVFDRYLQRDREVQRFSRVI